MNVAVISLKERRFRTTFFPIVETEKLVLIALCLFVGGLSFLPLLRLLLTAFMPEGVVDLGRMIALLGRKQIFTATLNTVHVAVLSTLLSTILGTLAAFLATLTDMRARTLWVFAFILPLMLPPQVIAFSWIQALAPDSPAGAVLSFVAPSEGRSPLYSATGIIILLGLYNAPLVFLSVRAALRQLPSDLVEAARAGGASPFIATRTIILPLVRTGIIAGAALSFVSSIGNFGIQAMLGIPARFPTLITQIYQSINQSGPSALSDMAILSLVLVLVTVLGLFASGWLGGKKDVRMTQNGRSIRFQLGRFRIWIESSLWIFTLLTFILPLSALVSTSLVSGYGQTLNTETLTFANYTNALYHHGAIRTAFLTSFWLTALTALVLVVASIFLAYFLTWKKNIASRFLQMTTELAYALPGIIIGIAAILSFLKPLPLLNVSLYGTAWIILIAYLSNFLALALRPTLSGFSQIDRSLEEAAQVAGAGFLTRMRDIIVPLAAPSIVAGAVIVFMAAFNEIQVSVLLVSSNASTIGPSIIFLEESGASTLAAAVGCLMVVAVIILMLLVSFFAHRLPKGTLPWHS